MFGPRLQQRARQIAEMVVRPLARLGLTPNMATLIGLLLNGLTAVVLAFGYLRPGGALLLFAGLFDMVDGALARVRNQKTVFGAFFDSTLDRYSEGLVLLGIIIYASTHANATLPALTIALAYLAGLGSLMVSYARARAEGLGLELKSGLMARPERVVLLAAGLLIGGDGWLPWTLLVLAVTSVFTSVQRIVAVWLRLRGQPTVPNTSGVAGASGTATVEQPTTRAADATGANGNNGNNGNSSGINNDTRKRATTTTPSVPSERPARR